MYCHPFLNWHRISKIRLVVVLLVPVARPRANAATELPEAPWPPGVVHVESEKYTSAYQQHAQHNRCQLRVFLVKKEPHGNAVIFSADIKTVQRGNWLFAHWASVYLLAETKEGQLQKPQVQLSAQGGPQLLAGNWAIFRVAREAPLPGNFRRRLCSWLAGTDWCRDDLREEEECFGRRMCPSERLKINFEYPRFFFSVLGFTLFIYLYFKYPRGHKGTVKTEWVTSSKKEEKKRF